MDDGNDDTDVDLIDAGKGESKLSKVKGEIENVMDGMKANIGKVIERGDHLINLNERSDELSNSASMFQSRARSARRNMYFRTCRVKSENEE